MQKFLFVFIGSGIGGMIRYAISLAFVPGASLKFPWHTFVANLVASFLVGLFYGMAISKNWIDKPLLLLLTTGLCGGLSTFSTFSYETLRLWENGCYMTGTIYVLFSIVACLLFTYIGTRIIH